MQLLPLLYAYMPSLTAYTSCFSVWIYGQDTRIVLVLLRLLVFVLRAECSIFSYQSCLRVWEECCCNYVEAISNR